MDACIGGRKFGSLLQSGDGLRITALRQLNPSQQRQNPRELRVQDGGLALYFQGLFWIAGVQFNTSSLDARHHRVREVRDRASHCFGGRSSHALSGEQMRKTEVVALGIRIEVDGSLESTSSPA